MTASRVLVIALFLMAEGTSAVQAGSARIDQVDARHKSGPVTMRGIAHHVSSRGFTLQTTTHGSYVVDSSPPTQVVEKGLTGRVNVVEGSHVGVRGYIRGRTIRAIEVRVYPVAPKPVTVRGTITSIAGKRLQIRTNNGSRTILLTTATVVRTSSAVLPASGLRVGDRVDARVVSSGHDSLALHIHVYRAKARLKPVKLSGTVTSVGARSVVVLQSGTRQSVSLTSTTRYYAGTSRSTGSLRAGEQVTVYACCAGQPLVATSIHIRLQRSVVRTTALRGTVIAISTTTIRLDTRQAPLVQLQPSTRYEVGTARTTRTAVRLGDLVSVTGHASGGAFKATRVHVYESSRRTTTVRGIVAGISAGSIRVVVRGAAYTVQFAKGTTTRLAGHSIPTSQIHVGDHARAVGHLTGHQLQATSVDLIRPAPKLVTVRGTVSSAGTSWLVVTRTSGARDTVRLTAHTRIVLGGRQTTANTLFPGIHVVARGSRSGAELQASTVAASAKSASVQGRLSGSSGRTLLLRRSSGTVVRIDLPSGVALKDGSHTVTLGQVGRGAYLHVTGYVELSKAIRALALTVLHPMLELSAVLTWRGHTATVRTTGGESYFSLFGKRSAINATHLAVSLRPSDIPSGTPVHVAGTVDISGSLAVQTLTARLRSETIRARLDSTDGSGLVLNQTGGAVHVRLIPNTTYFQGSRALVAADVVVGDDLTVYGYGLSGGVIVARKITVHRRLLGLDGTVSSTAGQSFVLTAADGAHTVLVSSTTLVFGTAGTVLAAGMKVHVTGYLRGDAVILATRVRIVKVA